MFAGLPASVCNGCACYLRLLLLSSWFIFIEADILALNTTKWSAQITHLRVMQWIKIPCTLFQDLFLTIPSSLSFYCYRKDEGAKPGNANKATPSSLSLWNTEYVTYQINFLSTIFFNYFFRLSASLPLSVFSRLSFFLNSMGSMLDLINPMSSR